jgi:hypothetical protein
MATYSFMNFQLTMTGPGAAAINLGAGAAIPTEGVTVDMVEDKNQMSIGADGKVMHSLRANRGATLTVRLQQVSRTNRILSDVYASQTSILSGGLYHGQNIFTLTDVLRGDSYTMSEAAFKRFPSRTWAQDGNMVEWSFDVGICDPLLGEGFGPIDIAA